MSPIVITIPGEAVAKGRPRVTMRGGHAHAYTPAKTARYEDLVRLKAGEVMEGAPLEGPLAVSIDVYRPIPKALQTKPKREAIAAGTLRPITKPDVDNYAKTIDALNKIVWRDDGQVVDLTVRKFYSDIPRLTITIEIPTEEEGA